jgi:hypothetical protein
MMYTLVFLFLFICSNPSVQDFFASIIGKKQPDVISGFCLALLFSLVMILLYNMKQHTSEPFLFKVSNFNPRCNGLYNGKPNTFQYQQIGCNYNKPVGGNPDMILNNQQSDTSIKGYCTPEQDQPLGFIASPNKDKLYGSDPHYFQSFGDSQL